MIDIPNHLPLQNEVDANPLQKIKDNNPYPNVTFLGNNGNFKKQSNLK